ncbi:hypothetical protein RFM98_06480 [Mesorhizobium sp. VK9D]|nr:hypothetical protein [Mesorhizobium sp. VK9D]MDX8452396.1 hypothetical protein [Mesorhizobium sp. VK9D]
MVRVEGGQNDNARGRILLSDLAHSRDTVENRHTQVEQRDIRMLLPPEIDGIAAGCGFRDDQHVRLTADDCGQAFAHRYVVVGTRYADRAKYPAGRISTGAPMPRRPTRSRMRFLTHPPEYVFVAQRIAPSEPRHAISGTGMTSNPGPFQISIFCGIRNCERPVRQSKLR